MKRRALLLGCALALALGSAPSLASAQASCTANPATCSPNVIQMNVSITIGRAIYLTLSPGSTTLTPPTPTDYNNGYAPTTGPTATVYANTGWTLSISAATATWTGVATGTEPVRAAKPAADLQWSLTSGGTFTDLTTAPVAVTPSGVATAGTPTSIFYRTKYAWTLDTPGNYSIGVVFTLTSP